MCGMLSWWNTEEEETVEAASPEKTEVNTANN